MCLPADGDELFRWRTFILRRWIDDHNIWFAIVQAVCLGMNMRRADYLVIVRDYCDGEDTPKCNGPCSPDFDIEAMIRCDRFS